MSNWRGCTCMLRDDSPFRAIFNGPVPIKSINPCFVQLDGDSETEAYMLAWSGCTPEQKYDVAKLVTKLRGGGPDEFLKYMDNGGDMPIRISQTHGAAAPLSLFL